MSCSNAKSRRLARLYGQGVDLYHGLFGHKGDQNDRKLARQLWWQGAREGCTDAMLMLGATSGRPAHCHYWYMKAASKGNTVAMHNLGDDYSQSGDWQQANHWFMQAASRGDGAASYSLAFNFQYGRGQPIDLEQARYWYRRAATKGHPYAMYSLSRLLEGGTPAEQRAAREWLKMGVSYRDRDSVLHFVLRYVPKTRRGIEWLVLACTMRHVTAIYWLVREIEQGRIVLSGEVTLQDLRDLVITLSKPDPHPCPLDGMYTHKNHWCMTYPMTNELLPPWEGTGSKPLVVSFTREELMLS